MYYIAHPKPKKTHNVCSLDTYEGFILDDELYVIHDQNQNYMVKAINLTTFKVRTFWPEDEIYVQKAKIRVSYTLTN